jgi:lathosterol oxidase
MDLVLEICDDLVFDKLWAAVVPLSDAYEHLNSSSQWQWLPRLPNDLYSSPLTSINTPISAWPRDYVPRQLISLCVLTLIGIHVLYFLFAWLSYKFIFNHEMMRHPRFLKNQVKLEIQTSLWSFPGMTVLTLPWFQGEVMGYSKLYRNVDDYGWFYLIASVPL